MKVKYTLGIAELVLAQLSSKTLYIFKIYIKIVC